MSTNPLLVFFDPDTLALGTIYASDLVEVGTPIDDESGDDLPYFGVQLTPDTPHMLIAVGGQPPDECELLIRLYSEGHPGNTMHLSIKDDRVEMQTFTNDGELLNTGKRILLMSTETRKDEADVPVIQVHYTGSEPVIYVPPELRGKVAIDLCDDSRILKYRGVSVYRTVKGVGFGRDPGYSEYSEDWLAFQPNTDWDSDWVFDYQELPEVDSKDRCKYVVVRFDSPGAEIGGDAVIQVFETRECDKWQEVGPQIAQFIDRAIEKGLLP